MEVKVHLDKKKIGCNGAQPADLRSENGTPYRPQTERQVELWFILKVHAV